MKIKDLTITNWKGIKSLHLDFDNELTNIYGTNETGKTTIVDAFYWLLYDKNSADKSDFNIKNTVHKEMNKADHVAGITILTDDHIEIPIKKVFREVWSKKTGDTIPKLIRHEVEYWWNGASVSMGEYNSKIDSLLPRDKMRLLTNVAYFNNLKEAERRRILLEIAGENSNSEIISQITTPENKKEVSELVTALNSHKTPAEYRKEIKGKISKVKGELEEVGPRIDEIIKGMPEAQNFEALEQEEQEIKSTIADLDTAINDRSALIQKTFKKVQDKQAELNGVKNQLSNVDYNLRLQIQEEERTQRLQKTKLSQRVEDIKTGIKSKTILFDSTNSRKNQIDTEVVELRQKFFDENAKPFEFDRESCVCPSCKRKFETENIDKTEEEHRKNFNEAKQKKLLQIREQGTHLNKEKADCDELVVTISKALEGLKSELQTAEKELADFNAKLALPKQSIEERVSTDPKYLIIQEQINTLEAELKEMQSEQTEDEDLEGYKKIKVEGEAKLKAVQEKLADKKAIERANERIEEIKVNEQKLTQQQADYEKTLFVIDAFERVQVEIMNERISGKFKYAEFQMFETLLNEGNKPCCITLYKGVPYADVNNAGKINVSLDIINTLCAHYNFYPPVFIDNAESVTQLIHSNNQLIRLVVSEQDKALRVVLTTCPVHSVQRLEVA